MSSFESAKDIASFDKAISAGDIVIAKFQTRTCVKCRQLEPGLKQIAERMAGALRVMEVDAEEQATLAERYGIRSVPTLILFKDGNELTRRDGFQSISMLREWVTPYINN